MGLMETFASNMKPRSNRNSGHNGTSMTIKAGIWGLYFVILYFLSIFGLSILSFSQPMSFLFCFPVIFGLAIIPALMLTAGLWLFWNLLLFFWPVKGLQIGHELGKFELALEGGWQFSKLLLKQKMTLNLTDSSPHILIVGGSQTGKSSTLKTILTKLVDKPKHPIIEAIRQSILPIIAVLVFLILFYQNNLIALLPFMLVIGFILMKIGHLTHTALTIGLVFVILGLVVSLVGPLVWFIRRQYSAIIASMNENRRNVILDFHGEYGFLTDRGFTIIDARNYDPLSPNYEGERFDHIVSDYVDAFLVAYETTGDVQLAILKKQLEEKRDVKAALSAIISDARSARSYTEKDRLTGLYLRLEKLVAYGGNKTIGQLTKDSQNIIFDFSGIRDRDAADFYAENILSRFMAKLVEKDRGINIIIDEAHRLNTKPLEEKGFEPTTIRIARESGKFGGRLIIASQNLSDFPAGFSANFGNIICFRTPSGAELQILEKITGIGYGLLQSVMNNLHKGEALLIGSHDHYSLIQVLPKAFPPPVPRSEPAVGSSTDEPVVAPKPPVRSSRVDEIMDLLKKEGVLTATEISRRTNYPKPAVWRHLQTLAKAGKVIRYEETETSEGMEIFYEVNDPNRNESSFHKMLIGKVLESLKDAKVLGGPNNPDLVLGTIAIEVETGTKPNLDGFVAQVKRRFEQGYSKVVVVVINQKQKVRYAKALEGIERVDVVKFTELAKL